MIDKASANAQTISPSEKSSTIQYGYSMLECFPKHSRMGTARMKETEQDKKRGVRMERSKASKKKRSLYGPSLPKQNTIIINIIRQNFIR